MEQKVLRSKLYFYVSLQCLYLKVLILLFVMLNLPIKVVLVQILAVSGNSYDACPALELFV